MVTVPSGQPDRWVRSVLPHCAATAGETGATPATASIRFASAAVSGSFGARGLRVGAFFVVVVLRVRPALMPAATRTGSFARLRAFDVTVNRASGPYPRAAPR